MEDRELWILGIAVLLIFLLFSGGGMMGFGMGFGIIFWVLLIAMVVYLLTSREKAEKREDSATKILNERYAKGEISREEYLEKKKELEA